ncbi:response regulator [Rhodobacteraceae bacterium NNCM2]|nr:response regulator [Coraliihabitans acroporae]
MILISGIPYAHIFVGLILALTIAIGVAIFQHLVIRRQSRSIEANKNNLAALLDHAPVEIALKDHEGRYITVNKRYEELFEMHTDDVAGLMPDEIHSSAVAKCAREHDLETLESGETSLATERVLTREGLKDLSIVRFPVRGASGEISGLGAIIQDVSEQVSTQRRVELAETLLSDTINMLPAGFAHIEANGLIGQTNSRFQQMMAQLGISTATRPSFEVFLRLLTEHGTVPEAEGQQEDWITRHLSGGLNGYSFEFQLPNGRWLKAYHHPLPDGGMIAVQLDITAAKELDARAAARPDETDHRYASIARTGRDWFWEQDKDLRFTFISENYQRLIGSPSGSRIGLTREEMHNQEQTLIDGTDWDWLNAKLAAREPFDNFVYGMLNKDGRPVWVRISGAPYYDESGLFAGYRGVGSDVTRIYSAMRKAEAANRAKSEFLANMSHEIRTPLGGVLGMAEELDRRITDPDQRQFIDTLRVSGEHLLQIINDVLDFSKIEAGKLELDTISFSVAEMVEKVAAAHRMRAEEKGVKFTLNLDGGCSVPRLGDPHRIRQVLHNILGNAVKFTDQGEVTLSVGAPVGQPITFVIQDTGIGMSEEQINQCFEDFSQADISIARRFGGTGLGMTITKRLVDAMNGVKHIDSELGEGTTITIALPLEIATEAAEAEKPVITSDMVPPGLRVLAVDDNATNRILIDLLLKQIRAKATIVPDGRTAIQRVEDRNFDIILMDIAMPEMDGIETLAAIRQIEQQRGRRHAPTLAVTANALEHQIRDYMAKGFDGHVSKPIQIETLFAEIMRICAEQDIALEATGTT